MHQVMYLLKQPISLYGNLNHDILYIDPEMNGELSDIFELEIDEWLTPAARETDGIKHMAIGEGYWQELDPENEEGMFICEEDPRLKLAELDGLNKVTLVNDRDDVAFDDQRPPLDAWVLVEYPDKVVVMEHSLVFRDISQDTGWSVPKMSIGRIVYD